MKLHEIIAVAGSPAMYLDNSILTKSAESHACYYRKDEIL